MSGVRPPRRRYGSRVGNGIYLRHPLSLEHETGSHPENKRRTEAIESRLESLDWLGLEPEEAPAATREQITRVHTPEHYEAIEAFCERGGGMVDLDTIASPRSFDAALRGAGAAANAAERLLAGDADYAFCGLRPPGHHAEVATAMGFCLFNSAAVGAAHAIEAAGIERALILDWD